MSVRQTVGAHEFVSQVLIALGNCRILLKGILILLDRLRDHLHVVQGGSLIGMKRSAGENIDLYVGGTPIGCGEIVVVENTLGVRITDFNGDV